MANRLRILNGVFRRCYATSSQAEPPLNLTESCVKRIKNVQDGNTYLRLAVEGGGCSGFQYKFELDSNDLADDDCTVEKDGAKLVVDLASLELIRGSVINYREELIRSAFRVENNPRSSVGCSCGTSFSIKL
ncbi:hypothetical protein CHUAL_006237 [Chamberlinius hualienensis]